MKRFRPYLAGALLGILALAMLPLSGLIGHQARDTYGVLGWHHWLSVRQSVTLRSLTTTVPPLDDPTMVRRAAGHYELVCASCHGSPAAPAERFAQDIWPPAPSLTEVAARWRPAARTFQTVKFGVRHTAMPGWPVLNRDDEVWDMVAFLRALPDLSPDEYRAMAGTGQCTDCHGDQGQGRDGIPRLDIQTPEYIAAALHAFRDGTRASGTMIAAARQLSDQQIDALALEFGRANRLPVPVGAPLIATKGLPGQDVPACLSCHGATALPTYPSLFGQDADYLRRQLHLFIELGEARGGPHADKMAEAVRWLELKQADALVDWFAKAD